MYMRFGIRCTSVAFRWQHHEAALEVACFQNNMGFADLRGKYLNFSISVVLSGGEDHS